MAEVQVWAAQLAANDFPPVCAMTGAPAETWVKFRFKTLPTWAGASNALAFTHFHLLTPVIEEASMRRASGRLPLTKSSKRRLRAVNLGLLGLIPAAMVLTVIAIAIDSYNAANAPFGGIFVGLALLSLAGGILGLLYVAPRFGPTGVVMGRRPGYHDSLVELRRVHPSFVAAVQRHQQARAAQLQAAPSGDSR